jgi:hypothetical protein
VKAAAQTIEILRSSLQTGLLSGAVESAAAHYARLSTDAESRLEMIATMIEKGSDYQALQTAEQEPPLLDLVAVLSFGGEKAWMDFCQAHQLPIAPRLDAKTVQALDRLYAQGVTANHPLYKDFRAAVLSREDEKALRIVRTILKLNPGDENARSELLRLENKHLQDVLEQLRAALKTDDEERISKFAESLARSVPEEKLRVLPDYQQADAIRRALRRRQAEGKIPTLLDEAGQLREAGDWRGAALALEVVRELIETHDIDLPTGSVKDQLESLTEFVRKERVAAERKRGFERALSSFTVFAEEADTRLLTGAGLPYAVVADMDESFVRRWRELESYQMPVPDATLQRLRQTGQTIRTRLEQLQSHRRTRSLLSAAALIAFLLGIAALAWHGWRARAFADELVSYRARQLCEPAEKLIATLRADASQALRWPFLQTKIEEIEVWTRQARELATQADQTLTQLESEAAKNFNGTAPAEVLKRLENTRTLLGQLPGDLAAPASNRLTALKSKSELMLSTVNQERSGSGRKTLDEITLLLEKELNYERPAAAVAATIQKLEPMLASLESWLKPEADSLQLPADLEARVKAARLRVTGFKAELERFAKVREATAGALTLNEYKKSLPAWQDIRFAEAAPASSVLSAIPTEEQFLASLLTEGDLAVWKAAVDDVAGAHMMPEAPQDTDLKILLSLRDDPYLNGVWESTVVDHARGQATRSVWSQGPLEESRAGETLRRWSGLCFDPHAEDTGAAFVKSDFKRITAGSSEQGQSVRASKLSVTSEFMSSLQLNRMTDANGERWQRSVLEVFDKIMADKAAPALVKTYIMLEIDRLCGSQPYVWGLHLTPTLRADFAELRKILRGYPLRSEDWLLPKVRTDFGTPLGKFFESRRGRTYQKEAQARRELLRDISVAGLKFGGYVETDRTLHLNNAARARKELWLLGESGPLLMDTQAEAAPAVSLALSPVFFIPADRAALMQRYHLAMSGSFAETPAPASAETPFFKVK